MLIFDLVIISSNKCFLGALVVLEECLALVVDNNSSSNKKNKSIQLNIINS